ncbi:hypothetical protein PGA1_c32830 [Phaeobacter inhibens DSM 17395]|nr:hypothetical protein PGA1_c32830 [Phaeobacter inhibens DSM 17395]
MQPVRILRPALKDDAAPSPVRVACGATETSPIEQHINGNQPENRTDIANVKLRSGGACAREMAFL